MTMLIKRKVSENGTIYITVEKRYFGGLIKIKQIYSSNKVTIGSFRSWVKEPNKLLVPDKLSYKLDELNRLINAK